MSERTKRLTLSTIKRNAPRRGPTSSDKWNDSWDEVTSDLAAIQAEWNARLLPLTESLPNGTDATTIDAWKTGLDASTIYVDSTLTNSSVIKTYYDVANLRPVTIKEALEDLYDRIAAEVETLNEAITTGGSGTGLTDTQKARIGSNVFDSSATSSATSLDGKSENNRLNIIQVARDVYGSGYALGNDGAADLTYSVMEMVDALLELHNGNWSDDISLSHTGVAAAQADIGPSLIYNDSFAGSPTTTTDDLNQVRTRIKAVAGGAAWTTTLPALYTGGASTLKGLLDSTYGSGTKSSNNPWGYRYDNIDSLAGILESVRDFTGQGSLTDRSPLYSGQNYITNGQPLEHGVSTLDQSLYTVSGIVQSGFWGTEAATFSKDLEVTISGYGVVMTSPDGTRWRIQIDNTGALTTTSL